MAIRLCSMCRNHYGDNAPAFKDHKCTEFDNEAHIEMCEKGCKKVHNRRQKVAETKKYFYGLKQKQNGSPKKKISPSNATLPADEISKGRKCVKCTFHGIKNAFLKYGHLKACPYNKCNCDVCKMITSKRAASNDFTKHHRDLKTRKQKCARANKSRDLMMPIASPDSGCITESDCDSICTESASNSPKYVAEFTIPHTIETLDSNDPWMAIEIPNLEMDFEDASKYFGEGHLNFSLHEIDDELQLDKLDFDENWPLKTVEPIVLPSVETQQITQVEIEIVEEEVLVDSTMYCLDTGEYTTFNS